MWVGIIKLTNKIDFAGVEPGSWVRLLVCSETFSPDKITTHLGVVPTETYVKGTTRNLRRHGKVVHKTHNWEFQPTPGGAGFLGRKLAFLADSITGYECQFASLPPSCVVEVSITSWCWEDWAQGFRFSKQIVALAAAIGAYIDIDLYSVGPELPPDP
ncbi:MAG: DUF4279 domain-containing protein [Armatimonadota bacterium]|nr:DUF4279 domain-containing protein [Armatimonadota bacterium]